MIARLRCYLLCSYCECLSTVKGWKEKRPGSVTSTPRPLVLRGLLRSKLDVCAHGSRDVIAALPACARFTGACSKAFVIALHAFNGVSRAGLFILNGVAAESVDADERLDRAGFVDGVLQFRGCRELNHYLSLSSLGITSN